MMIKIALEPKAGPLHILCVGSHSDDVEIGCGGTLLTLLAGDRDVSVTWVVLAGGGPRKSEAVAAAREFTEGAHSRQILVEDFRDGFFPYRGEAVKEYFEELKAGMQPPHLVFTHFRGDLHQDHRVVSDLTWNTFRDHLILEYEIVKYDADLGVPNFFVPLSGEVCRKKVDILMEHHRTQGEKDWFTPETFFSIMRIRGVECRAEGGYAEAFHARKMVL